MKKALRFLLLNFIFLVVFLSLFGCELLDLWKKPHHICSFENPTVISGISCTTDGITVSSCICGRVNTEITPALGHSFGEWETVLSSSCSKPGRDERICSICGTTQTKALERTDHDYRVSEETIDGTIYNRYTCLTCGESFTIDAGISLPVTDVGTKYLSGCPEDISFIVICTQDEDYLRQNLRITNFYYESSDYSEGDVDYNVTSLGNFRWLISPAERYTPGYTYLALRSEGVLFEEYGFSDLVFSIFREDRDELSLTDGIIYVGALEAEIGGYYPFNIDLSGGSGEYFLSLEKADGLAVGDLICVGAATCANDVITEGGLNVFGKITSITTLGDGRSLIMLKKLSPEELFLALDLYRSDILQAENLKTPVGLEEKFRSALLSDADFLNMLDVLYEVGLEHLEMRGLSTDLKSAEDLRDSMSVKVDQTTLLITSDSTGRTELSSRIELVAEISIPAMLGIKNVGAIIAKVTLYAQVDPMAMTVQLKAEEMNSDEIYFSLDVTDKTAAGMSFDTYSAIDYEGDTDIYLKDNRTSVYHYKGCEEMKNAVWGTYTSTSVYELFVLALSGEAMECPLCQPLSSMEKNLRVIDNTAMEYHTGLCALTELADKTDLSFTERSGSLLDADYAACPLCCIDEAFGDFERSFADRVNEGDFKTYEDTTVPSNQKGSISIGGFSAVSTGIDRETVAISLNFDFYLHPSAHYGFELIRRQSFGYRSTENGIKKHVVEIKDDHSVYGITPAESEETPIDLKTEFSVYIAGFKPEIIGKSEANK